MGVVATVVSTGAGTEPAGASVVAGVTSAAGVVAVKSGAISAPGLMATTAVVS